MDPEFVVLRSYPARIHADLALSALHAHAIESFVRGGEGNLGRWVPGNPIELWVRSEDVERANDVLGDEETFSD